MDNQGTWFNWTLVAFADEGSQPHRSKQQCPRGPAERRIAFPRGIRQYLAADTTTAAKHLTDNGPRAERDPPLHRGAAEAGQDGRFFNQRIRLAFLIATSL